MASRLDWLFSTRTTRALHLAGGDEDKARDQNRALGNLRHLQTSPITSAHLWYDRPITRLPHVVLIDCVGQWLFNRGEVAPGDGPAALLDF